MRIAFVVQTYRALDQVGRLVDTLNRGCPDCLIVITHSGPADGLAKLAREHRISRILPAIPGRGRFGLVDSYLCALRWLRRQDVPYDWIVLLSGQDYPIRPLAEFSDAMQRSAMDGFFYHFKPLAERAARGGPFDWPREECVDRYFFRYASLKDELSLAERALLRLPRKALALSRNYRLHTTYGLSFGRRVEALPFSQDFELHGGSYWHTIRRECGESLLDFVDENPTIVDYFRHVILPDETFIPTVLSEHEEISHLSARDQILRFQQFAPWSSKGAGARRSRARVREPMLFRTEIRHGIASRGPGRFGRQGARPD